MLFYRVRRFVAYAGYAALAVSILVFAFLLLNGSWSEYPRVQHVTGIVFTAGVSLRLLLELLQFGDLSHKPGRRNRRPQSSGLIGPNTFPPEGPVL